MGYPQYFLTFKGKLTRHDDPSMSADGVMVDGTHTINLNAAGGTVVIELTHDDEEKDRVPKLILTFK
jgi:hypothetical protein